MREVKIIDIKESIFDDNNKQAEQLRFDLKQKGTFLLNVMSSPGSGKTSIILKTLDVLFDELKIGVMEADIDSAVDAEKIIAAGGDAIQLHTGGMCHLDAGMTRDGIENLDDVNYELVILENIGNLVCPAEFDTGASKSVMILSVPEGDDKPLKYPLMFTVCDALIINKIDCLDYFDFDVDSVKKRAKALNPDIEIFEISAKTGQGIEEWCAWLKKEVVLWNR